MFFIYDPLIKHEVEKKFNLKPQKIVIKKYSPFEYYAIFNTQFTTRNIWRN